MKWYRCQSGPPNHKLICKFNYRCHIALDEAREFARGADPIGETRRSVGPPYSDKAARVGLRASVLTQPTNKKT